MDKRSHLEKDDAAWHFHAKTKAVHGESFERVARKYKVLFWIAFGGLVLVGIISALQ